MASVLSRRRATSGAGGAPRLPDRRRKGERGRAGAHALLALVALACIALGIRGAVAERAASRDGVERFEGLRDASSLVPENHDYHRRLGDFLVAIGEARAAIDEYRAAIDDFALCTECWMGLAEARYAAGEDPVEDIARAVEVAPSDTTTRIRAATLYARLGRDRDAGREFSAAQGGMKKDLFGYYAMLHRIYDARLVLDHVIGDDSLPSYFAWLRQFRPIEDARLAWPRFESASTDRGESQRSMYAKALLDAGFVREAWDVAFAQSPRPVATLVDGGFEEDAESRPFGWHLRGGEGVEVSVERDRGAPEGERVLKIAFDGEENPRFGSVWQDLAVEPGRSYVLAARVKADGITSSNGPRLVVQGIGREGGEKQCGLWKATPDWKLSFDWKRVELEFTVPPSCDGVRVSVVRLPSEQFNKFLGGELRLDDLRLAPAG